MRNKGWIAALLAALSLCMAGAAAADRETVSLPVVMYHHISRDPAAWGPYVISEAELERDLQWLKAHGILTAIATANQVERTERLLRRIGLIEYFDRVIGADLVERGKPVPDTYRYACEVLALPPEQVIAVEDAPNGVLSAHAAGCRVIMVPDQSEPDELLKEKLFAVVPVLTDIIDLIDSPDGSKAEKGSR